MVIRLCFEGGGAWRAYRACALRCRARAKLTAPCTLKHAGSSRVRAPQRSRGEAASAPRLGTPPSRYDHDLGGMDTARHSIM